MSRYRIFDVVLRSTLALPELPTDDGANEAELFFELAPRDFAEPPTECWDHHWRQRDGQITISHGKLKSGAHSLRFPRLADFAISADGRHIRGKAHDGVPLHTFRHLLLDQVLPRVVSHFFRSVLHASAVLLPEGGIAFLGETGWGKSTLGLSFSQGGSVLLGDDALLIDSRERPPQAIASYAGARLWADSLQMLGEDVAQAANMAHYSSKKRVLPAAPSQPSSRPSSCSSSCPLNAIFVLDDPARAADVIEIEPVRGIRAAMALVEHCFHLDLKDHERVASQFDELMDIISGGCALYQLRYPREHARLNAVRAAIVERLR